jgi:hypothetical protein
VARSDRMGVDVETLTAVLGPAGAGAAMVSAICAWLGTRRNVKLRVEGPAGVAEFDARMGADQARRMLAVMGGMTGLTPPPNAAS